MCIFFSTHYVEQSPHFEFLKEILTFFSLNESNKNYKKTLMVSWPLFTNRHREEKKLKLYYFFLASIMFLMPLTPSEI